MSGHVEHKERVLLAFKSGGHCALCRKALTVDATAHDEAKILGVAAHIKGENFGSTRYDVTQPDAERNAFANLIYLCGDCHTTIDKQEDTYPVQMLLERKSEHEKWISSKIGESTLRIGFAELEVIAKAIIRRPHDPTQDFTLLSPSEKMRKNNLSGAVLEQLKIGYGKEPEVQRYVDHVVTLDLDFPERLKAGFVERYGALYAKGISGDELFFALHDFASQGSVNFMRQAAALSILAYLFQKCEVFEH